MASHTERLLKLGRKAGLVRVRDVAQAGIPPSYVYRLTEQGILERVSRGLYRIAGAQPITEHQSLIEANKRVPAGIVCLLSALQFHEMTTQAPFEVWLAIARAAWLPRVDYPPLRIVHFSGPAFSEGIETYRAGGTQIRVYAAAKTVADCFKYRNKIGADVAIEALRDYRRLRKGSADQLWHYAKICRVSRVMQPYLEASR